MNDPRDLPCLDRWLTTNPEDLDDERAMREAMYDDDREPDEPEVCGQFYDGQ